MLASRNKFGAVTLFVAVVLLVSTSIGLLGCGEAATATPTSAPAATKAGAQPTQAGAATQAATKAPTTVAATPTKAAKKGGVLTVAAATDNTNGHYDAPSGGIIGWMTNFDQCYESLFGHDPTTFDIIPKLALKYELAADATSITINLRQGVKWHNLPPVNGREFTSEDVKWNIEHVRDAKTPYGMTNYMKVVKSIETPDKYTVKLTFTQPYASITWWLADINFPMYPRELYDQYGDKQNKVAIGTGPFMFKSYEPKSSIEFVRNPDYYIPGTPLFDSYKIVYIPDAAARQAAFRSGQVQLMQGLPLDIKDALAKSAGVQTSEHVGYIYCLWMNNRVKPLDDVRVRKAINLAIDRPALIQLAQSGAGEPAGYYAPTSAPFDEKLADLLKRPGYRTPKDADIAEAKKLLADAGYPNGLDLEILTVSSDPSYVKHSEVLQSQLAAAGIKLQIKLMDFGAISAAFTAKDPTYQMFFSTWSTRGDPDRTNYFGTKSVSNNTGWGSPELDDLLAKGLAEGNLEKRIAVYKQINDKMFELNNLVILEMTKLYVVASPELRNWETKAKGPVQWQFEQLKYAWFDK